MLKLNKADKVINLIIVLGNIGKSYEKTRHNAGFLFAKKMVDMFEIKGLEYTTESANNTDVIIFPTLDLRILKPTTMMNNSGMAVAKYVKMNYSDKLDPSILLIHDDLDLPFGEYKIQKGKSPKMHNGVLSVEKTLGTQDFWRLRIGIDNRDKEFRESGLDYVLQRFSGSELLLLEQLFDEIISNEFSFL